ncbi:MAG: kelch repeat-containing protein [Tepidisphaeraceae bacterium]
MHSEKSAAKLESLETRRLLASSIPSSMRFDFGPPGSTLADYHRADTGTAFGKRGNGLYYGWSSPNRINAFDTGTPTDDPRLSTQIAMRKRFWEIQLPKGTYSVRVVAGDASNPTGYVDVMAEGTSVVSQALTAQNPFASGTATVTVTDGRLTIRNGVLASNNRLAFIEIRKGAETLPAVTIESTAATSSQAGQLTVHRTGSTDVALDVGLVSTDASGKLASLPTTVQIPAGQTSANVALDVDSGYVGTTSVHVALATAYGYSNSITARQTAVSVTGTTQQTSLGNLTWSTLAPSGAARTEHMTALVGNTMYVMGGYFNDTWLGQARMDKYNLATNTWTRMADLPMKLTHAGTATDGRYIYLVGGYTVNQANTQQVFGVVNCFRFDTQTETWSTMPNLPERRGAGGLALVGRTLYYMGGFDGDMQHDRDEIYQLDLDAATPTWTLKGHMPEPRNHYGITTIDGNVYVMLGQTGNDATAVFKRNAWRWNVATDTWTALADAPTPARSHIWSSTLVYQGRILLLGGETYGSDPDHVWSSSVVDSYDPVSNAWTRLNNLPAARSTGSAVVWNDRIYFAVGMQNGVFKDVTWVGEFN